MMGTNDVTLYAKWDDSCLVTNINTGATYGTIQAAIDAGASGQTIQLCPRVYYENIVLENKGITITSSNPLDNTVKDNTIIDGCGKDDSVIKFLNGDTSTLQGVTIRNGNSLLGGGIYIDHSSPTITENKIIDNTASYGAGIFMKSDPNDSTMSVIISSPTISNNIIENNMAGSYRGGIELHQSSPTIENNTINGNQAVNDDGGGIFVGDGDDTTAPIIIDNTITNNTADDYGGGIAVNLQDNATIEYNIISYNDANIGAGIAVYDNCDNVKIINNIDIDNNIATNVGGGVALTQYCTNVLISGNASIFENTAEDNGGGIYVYECDNITIGGENDIDANIISGNTTSAFGGGVYI